MPEKRNVICKSITNFPHLWEFSHGRPDFRKRAFGREADVSLMRHRTCKGSELKRRRIKPRLGRVVQHRTDTFSSSKNLIERSLNSFLLYCEEKRLTRDWDSNLGDKTPIPSINVNLKNVRSKGRLKIVKESAKRKLRCDLKFSGAAPIIPKELKKFKGLEVRRQRPTVVLRDPIPDCPGHQNPKREIRGLQRVPIADYPGHQNPKVEIRGFQKDAIPNRPGHKKFETEIRGLQRDPIPDRQRHQNPRAEIRGFRKDPIPDRPGHQNPKRDVRKFQRDPFQVHPGHQNPKAEIRGFQRDPVPDRPGNRNPKVGIRGFQRDPIAESTGRKNPKTVIRGLQRDPISDRPRHQNLKAEIRGFPVGSKRKAIPAEREEASSGRYRIASPPKLPIKPTYKDGPIKRGTYREGRTGPRHRDPYCRYLRYDQFVKDKKKLRVQSKSEEEAGQGLIAGIDLHHSRFYLTPKRPSGNIHVYLQPAGNNRLIIKTEVAVQPRNGLKDVWKRIKHFFGNYS